VIPYEDHLLPTSASQLMRARSRRPASASHPRPDRRDRDAAANVCLTAGRSVNPRQIWQVPPIDVSSTVTRATGTVGDLHRRNGARPVVLVARWRGRLRARKSLRP
jgi:hypothetical protein